jgi:hypothetical protein
MMNLKSKPNCFVGEEKMGRGKILSEGEGGLSVCWTFAVW